MLVHRVEDQLVPWLIEREQFRIEIEPIEVESLPYKRLDHLMRHTTQDSLQKGVPLDSSMAGVMLYASHVKGDVSNDIDVDGLAVLARLNHQRVLEPLEVVEGGILRHTCDHELKLPLDRERNQTGDVFVSCLRGSHLLEPLEERLSIDELHEPVVDGP